MKSICYRSLLFLLMVTISVIPLSGMEVASPPFGINEGLPADYDAQKVLIIKETKEIVRRLTDRPVSDAQINQAIQEFDTLLNKHKEPHRYLAEMGDSEIFFYERSDKVLGPILKYAGLQGFEMLMKKVHGVEEAKKILAQRLTSPIVVPAIGDLIGVSKDTVWKTAQKYYLK